MSDIEQYEQYAPISELDLQGIWDNPSQHATAVFNEGPIEREKLRLVGVPHIITEVVYHSELKFAKGYVTISGFIAPQSQLEYAIARGWIPEINSVSEMLFRPNEAIKYNDGSTGIRRQITGVLHNLGLIDVGPVESLEDFDRSWDEWESFTQAGQENGDTVKGVVQKIDIPHITRGKDGRPLAIFVHHGLRASYMDEYGTNVFYLS